MIHRTDIRFRFAFADVCVGVALGLFAGGAVAAFVDPTLGAILIGASVVCAVASIEIGRIA